MNAETLNGNERMFIRGPDGAAASRLALLSMVKIRVYFRIAEAGNGRQV